MPKAKGFTLLELLVVLAIVGILTAIGTASFTAAQIRARDSQRKADLKVIASALELYFQKNKIYPDSTSGICAGENAWFCSNSNLDPWIPPLTSTYIKKLPKDLKNTTGPFCDPTNGTGNPNSSLTYAYYSSFSVGTSPGKQYILSAKLENSKDPDVGKTIKYGSQTWSDHGCYAITSP